MNLLPDWKRVIRRAWSVRLTALAIAFIALEVALPVFADTMPRAVFAVLSIAAAIGALWARVTPQKGFHDA